MTTEQPALSSGSAQRALPAVARWLAPSLGGAAITVLAANVAGPLGARLLGDSDTGWHIVTGDLIRRTNVIPRADPFSFSMAGREWFAWEWLADCVMSLVHQALGLSGLVVVMYALLIAAHAISYRQATRRGADPMIAVPVLGLAALASSVHWLARPHVFSIFLLAVWLELAWRYRQDRSRAIWLVPALTVLWANVHGAFVVSFVLAGIFAAGEWLEHAVRGDSWGPAVRRVVRTYGIVALLAVGAGLVTPYGVALYGHMARYLADRELLAAVHEFASPDFHTAGGVLIELWLVGGAVAAGNALRRRQFVEPLLVLAWSHLSLQSVRHVPLAAVAMTPIVAHEWTLLVRELLDAIPWGRRGAAIASLRRRRANLMRIDRQANDAVVAVVLCAFAGWLLASERARALLVANEFSPRVFPVAAADVAQRGLREGWLTGRPYASDRFGGYLIYRFGGAVKVLVDGRSDFYRQGEVLADYTQIRAVGPAWSDLLRRYDVGWMLLSPGEALETAALLSGDWRRQYADAAASLLVRVR